ncbi:N-(5'-phosphoribosyl)anthranilate isomerase [Sulfitobacter sp. G21635-S1]|uniref:N-(5'-phosphoribosyl)anthranilate isomerase n=1 Tax=Sulfitobacter sp. G21635-S1 TaxID=3014043 RepID=UPI0022AFAC64|nr:N-(5'-phosphoribosyl)anthranilate isomerase [Sulfitobacter sp. G21635-S1]MCZ4255079.1 N-(5'-phosphoribosyl)anthranilate isomerase [Sulfitobacter sp. G21635-S1]
MSWQVLGMSFMPPHMTPDRWLGQLFASRAAQRGGVVRRSARDVVRIVGCTRFEEEIRRRGFRAVRNGKDYVVFCNREPLHLIE